MPVLPAEPELAPPLPDKLLEPDERPPTTEDPPSLGGLLDVLLDGAPPPLEREPVLGWPPDDEPSELVVRAHPPIQRQQKVKARQILFCIPMS